MTNARSVPVNFCQPEDYVNLSILNYARNTRCGFLKKILTHVQNVVGYNHTSERKTFARIPLLSDNVSVLYSVWVMSCDELLETTTSGGIVDAIDLERSLCWVVEVEDVTRTAGLNITYELTF